LGAVTGRAIKREARGYLYREVKPMRLVLCAVLLLASIALPAVPAAAQQPIYYPWCANYGGGDMGGGGGNCGFSTLEQCRANVSGIGGFCDPNPFYKEPAQKPAARKRKRS
jgi:hypothetical protein